MPKVRLNNNDNANNNFRMKNGLFSLFIMLTVILAATGLYFMAASMWPQLYYWPYPWPEVTPTPGQIAVPIVVCIIIATFVFFGWMTVRLLLNNHVRRGVKRFAAIWAVFMFVTGMFSISLAAPNMQFLTYDEGPYITWSTNQEPTNSITVCWHSAWNSGSKVQYGTDRSDLNLTAKSSEFGRFHQVSLTDLQPNTTYYYKAANFDVKQFTTAPIGPCNYTFTVWSDPNTNEVYEDAINQANLPKFMYQQLQAEHTTLAFSICAGDISERGVDYKTWKLWLQDITTDDFGTNASNQIAIGNHERHADTGARNFRNYYPYLNTSAGFSYSFDYGTVHFSVLDRWNYTDPWYGGDGAVQAQWLKQDLIAHSDSTFKILIMHNNPVMDDAHNGNCTLIMDVAKDYGIDVIFCGHWHWYEPMYFNDTDIITNRSMTQLNQGICMMIGIGGNSPDPNYGGYCQVDVTPHSLTLRPRWINGTWMDGFVINK